MREMKVIAWNRTKKEMSGWVELGFFDGQLARIDTMRGKAADTTLLQCIGLVDKDGRDCYLDYLVSLNGATWQVAWDDKCACVTLKRVAGEHMMKEIPAHNIPKSKIVGNIHENPELIDAATN